MCRIKIVCIVFILLFHLLAAGQQQGLATDPKTDTALPDEQHNNTNVHRHRCGTDEYIAELKQKNPAIAKHWEQYLEQLATESIQDHASKINKTAANEKYIIPVVIHVVHTGGRDSISLAQIRSQMQVLHEDFWRLPGSYGYGAGVEVPVEFALATIDPNGLPTTGIIYYKNPSISNFDRITEEASLKPVYSWPRENYMNIWLVREINGSFSGITGEVLGYSSIPSLIPPGVADINDGVVIRADCWGSRNIVPNGFYFPPAFFGGTATHELGHWLNLFHPFQGGCGGNCNSTGDLVCDTPPTADQNFGNGNTRQNTCRTETPDGPDNPRNFMDYLDDEYGNFFTAGQRRRALQILENEQYPQRYKLWQYENHQKTGVGTFGPPKAWFWVNNQFPSAGAPVKMKDYSRNMPLDPDCKYNWLFPGGTPSTSTDREPVVTYNAEGNYDVTLIVTNSSGILDTMVRKNFIQVSGKLTANAGQFFNEGFEVSGNVPGNGWRVENPDSAARNIAKTWRLTTQASGFLQSTKSAMMAFNTYADYNQTDALVSPAMDFSGKTGGNFAFSYAYTPFKSGAALGNLTFTDTLVILISNDGGGNWTELWRKGGLDLMTTASPSTMNSFVPTADQWKRDSVDIPEVLLGDKKNVRIKLQTINGWGGTLYIDDVVAYDKIITNIEVNDIGLLEGKLVPNPTQSNAVLSVGLEVPAAVNIEVVDIQGRLVIEPIKTARLDIGKHQITLPVENLSSGVYLVRVNASGRILTRRLVRQ